LLALPACLVACLLLAGCGKDDVTPESADAPEPVAAWMEMSFHITPEMLSVLDITIYYHDAEGEIIQIPMANTSWVATVKAPLPAIMGMRVVATAKPGVSLSAEDVFTASYGYRYTGYSVSEDGSVAGVEVSGGTDSSLSMKGDKVSDWLGRHEDGLVHVIYCFDENGHAAHPEPVG